METIALIGNLLLATLNVGPMQDSGQVAETAANVPTKSAVVGAIVLPQAAIDDPIWGM